ncbi:hypothetical protein AA313_de0209698 [Arthrobotrys entomopaga]|nr:hypothetical protein AA313_de0209698 [Arthrobotrys entomopaga]
MMPFKGAPNQEELKTKKTKLIKAIKNPDKAGNEPRDLDGAIQALADLRKTINEINSKPPEEKPWATLSEAMGKLTSSLEDVVEDGQSDGDDEEVVEPGSSSSKVRGLLRNIKSSLNAQMDNIRGNLRLCFKSKPGTGGPAGSGPGGNGTAGQKGDVNKQGGVKVKDMAFTENSSSLDIPAVLAQPDQCQMLLNIADDAYFLGPGEGYQTANSLYTRLTRRLHFVPKLLENLQTQPEPPLLTAYQTMEYSQKLTLNAVVQLKQIYERAQTSLHQLRATQQQDMFGKTEDWSPRFSYTFYRNRIKGLLTHIEILEKNYREYKDAPVANLKSAVEKASVHLANVIQQKEMLTKDNGPLETAANQIAVFTPILKKYRTDLKDAISIIEESIKSSLNTDPMIFLDALSQVAFSPEPFMIGVQGLTIGHKVFSTVQSSDGTQVEKSYVVEQFSYCNDDVQKLLEGYQSRKDGAYEVDDPGCAKIIAKREDFISLCQKFKGSMSKGTLETTLKLFNSYVDIIEKRNTAVMTYNATLHTLVQLIQDKSSYESQKDFFGQEVLEKGLDATLPAARFWVQKLLTDSKRSAFQYLSYGERSLRYWGLQDKFAKKIDYSLIKPSSAISQYQEQLEEAFTSALERYSTNPKNMFPGRTARKEKSSSGVIWALSKDEVNALCKSDNHAVYIKISAPRKGEGVNKNSFSSRADVRLDQVRLWLPKAKVDKGDDRKRVLLIHLNHTGRETIIRDDNREFNFSHDNTRLTFRYDPTTITGLDDITNGRIHDEQDIMNNFSGKPKDIETSSTCPIGPFALWYIQIFPNEHFGLDLSEVEEGYLEFWGSNVDFSN